VGADICSATAPALTASCAASAVGFVVNADSSVSLANAWANNGVVVTYTATSAATAQTATSTCSLSLVDTTPPVVTCAISTPSAQCEGPDLVISATAEDVCQGSCDVECECPHDCTGCTENSDGSVSLAAVLANNGVTITCHAVDHAGNTGTCQQVVQVVDTQPPEVGPTQKYEIPCDNQCHTVTASDCGVDDDMDACDNCAATATLVSVAVDESCACSSSVKDQTSTSVSLLGSNNSGGDGRVYTLTWQLTDKSGNSATQLCEVYVGDSAVLSGTSQQC